MKTRGLLGALALLLLGAAGEPWMRLSPQGEDYLVSVPRRLERQETTSETPVGPQRSVVHSISHGFETFAVLRTRYARTLLERVRTEDLLEASQRRLASDFGARLVRQEEIRIEGRAGREIQLEDRNHRFVSVARLFLADDQFYTLVGITRRPGRSQHQIRRFLDSFSLAPPP